MQGIGEDT